MPDRQSTAASLEKPLFLITIDTEGDNLWEYASGTIETKNARFLPRFQQLCERYGLKPTWLTNYEMAENPAFCEFGRDVLRRATGEIGMHLHAWNSPPLVPLTDDDMRHMPYLIEYPQAAMQAKVSYLTELLEERFEQKMVSHRSGRWAFNDRYAKLLMDHGYLADCSVTPHVSWQRVKGDPQGRGGTDFSHFPSEPYFIDPEQIHQAGTSSLLEVPVSIVKTKYASLSQAFEKAPSPISRGLRWLLPATHWMRPKKGNRRQLLSMVAQARQRGTSYLEFMIHSSELMPGGSPTFRTEAEIETLYQDLEALFEEVVKDYRGATLHEFYAQWIRRRDDRAADSAS